VPQSIGQEENLMANEIEHFHSSESSLLIINHLKEKIIVKQEPLNFNSMGSLRAQIELVTTDNSSLWPICQP
jgi:hypothetical protein